MESILIDDLISTEDVFMNLSMPSHAHTSQDVLGNKCCSENCVLFLSRFDVLSARFHYVRFYNSLDGHGKKDYRRIFISTLTRSTGNKFMFAPIGLNVSSCPTLIARVFGFSTHVLFNGISNTENNSYKSRTWYNKTVEALSLSLHSLSKCVQMNSLNRLMLPPNFSARTPLPDSIQLPISMIRERMELKIQKRKSDSLTRCVSCCSLPEIIGKAITVNEKKEAEKMLRLHHIAVSQQRVIIDCLTRQSRDPDINTTVLLMDSMSNRYTKLPILVNRPKSIGDADRVPISLSTVQMAEDNGELKFRNIEYPILQTLFSHDSSFNLSILFDALTKLRAIGSTIFLVMDSCRNNKSFSFIGGVGYLLTKLKHVKQITLIYPSVGHTHLSVDGHFGVLGKALSDQNIKDPHDFESFLNGLPSVTHVNSFPTIFDFSKLVEHMHRPKGLCSNGVINVFCNSNNEIIYSSSLTMNSNQLIGAETGQVSKKLFKDNYYGSNFSPVIMKPTSSEVQQRIESLVRSNQVMFSQDNEINFKKYCTEYGRKSINELIMEINALPFKTPQLIATNSQDPQMCVLKYLESKGINAGRTPQEPVVVQSQLLS